MRGSRRTVRRWVSSYRVVCRTNWSPFPGIPTEEVDVAAQLYRGCGANGRSGIVGEARPGVGCWCVGADGTCPRFSRCDAANQVDAITANSARCAVSCLRQLREREPASRWGACTECRADQQDADAEDEEQRASQAGHDRHLAEELREQPTAANLRPSPSRRVKDLEKHPQSTGLVPALVLPVEHHLGSQPITSDALHAPSSPSSCGPRRTPCATPAAMSLGLAAAESQAD